MIGSKWNKVYLSSVITVIFIIAAYIQSHSLINWDVSDLLRATQLLLAGGTYAHHFFETNPPMILFLYIPPVIFSKVFAINVVTSLRLYGFLLSLISLLCCYFLSKKIFLQNHLVLFITLISLAVVFLLLPAHDFGQREHLLLILIMPYLFACSVRLYDRPINTYFACFIGVLAGLGFAIKPFFIVPLVMVESFFIVYRCNFLAWLRVESIVILSVLALYVAAIFYVTPDYIYIVLPKIFYLYYAGLAEPLSSLITRHVFLFCFFPIIMYFVQYQKNKKDLLSTVLLLALIGFIYAYLIEHILWFYHLLPAMGLAVLLTVVLFSQLWTEVNGLREAHRSIFINSLVVLLGVLALWLPAKQVFQFDKDAMNTGSHECRREIIKFLSRYPSIHTLYFFSHSTCYSVVDYVSHKKVASRFTNLWWLPGIMNKYDAVTKAEEWSRLEQEKHYFINAVLEDFINNKPDLVFVDLRPVNAGFGRTRIVDYERFFSQNTSFRAIWKHYHYVGNVACFRLYQRDKLA